MMKRTLLLSLLLICMSACQNNASSKKVQLSYGSRYDQVATFLSAQELETRIANEESFLLAMSPGNEDEVTCSCWKTFSYIIDEYVKNNDAIVYKCDVYNAKKYGVEPPINQDPGFAVFENGTLKKQYVYTTKNTPTYFTNKDAFKDFVASISENPKMVYVDDSEYQRMLQKDDEFVVSIVRKGCSDCGYMLPNVIDPFFKNNKTNKNLYLLDIEDLGHYKRSTPEEEEAYQEYKNSLYLSKSTNPTFGYSTGVVPTTFVYENKVIKDANVFFNDSVSKTDEGKYIISQSYYTEERIKELTYTNVVLQGKELSEDEVAFYNEYVYLPSSSASKYHVPILESFLNYYFK